MNNKLPKALTDRQEQQRQQTINRVLHALDYLDGCGMNHTVKNLVEVTGLSRSVFSKPHVREVVENYRLGNDSPTEEQNHHAHRDQESHRAVQLQGLIDHQGVTQDGRWRKNCRPYIF